MSFIEFLDKHYDGPGYFILSIVLIVSVSGTIRWLFYYLTRKGIK